MKPSDIIGKDLDKILKELERMPQQPIAQEQPKLQRSSKREPKPAANDDYQSQEDDEAGQPEDEADESDLPEEGHEQDLPQKYLDEIIQKDSGYIGQKDIGIYDIGPDTNYDIDFIQKKPPTGHSKTLSAHELGQLLENNIWGYALGMYMRSYEYAVQNGLEGEAKFIRTDVQKFVEAKGRHRFRPIPYKQIQDFIDECVNSSEVLDDEEFRMEWMMRIGNRFEQTLDDLIKDANQYHKARRNRNPNDDRYGGGHEY